MVSPGIWREGCPPPRERKATFLDHEPSRPPNSPMSGGRITVLLADDNLIVREGVRALLGTEPDFDVVAVAADYDELVARAGEFVPQVLVTDIRMPPNFQSEGIEAAKHVRKMNPGT